jgi:hypothetical protein
MGCGLVRKANELFAGMAFMPFGAGEHRWARNIGFASLLLRLLPVKADCHVQWLVRTFPEENVPCLTNSCFFEQKPEKRLSAGLPR